MKVRPGCFVTKPDAQWEASAQREPYFTVFTSPKFLRANLTAAHEREFFDTGETFVESTFRTIAARFVPDFAPASILEYGCGVGRLAIPFARRAGSVTAVDRSPSMLDVARTHATRRAVANISFQTPSELFGKRKKFDLVNCYLVLQRLRPSEGLALLTELVGCLGAGGIAVLQFAYRTRTSHYIETLRRLRERVPAVNGVANLLRGNPVGQAFLPTHTYDLNDVVRTLHAASIRSHYVMFEESDGLSSAIVFVEAPLPYTSYAGVSALGDTKRSTDVGQMIARTSIEALNRSAEAYFASLRDWEHHLAKPFSNVGEMPELLIDAGTILQGLRVTPGATVLEFGAGTGWLSRFLTQAGCRVILLDVSETALRIARELYQRLPIIGDRPAPEFLPFDGRRIDLADASVDRVLSFDAFHHAPDPKAVLRELGRVLKPGGIAGFVEPGPSHSRSAMSQFEMRTYGVVENDVDIQAIWRTAQTCGFTDLKLIVFHDPPFHVSLEEYEDLLAGGPTCARWVTSTRGFLRHVRSFLLFKGGAADADSRSADGLACSIHVAPVSEPVVDGHEFVVDATVTNSGVATWLPSSADPGGVALGVHLYDSSRRLVTFDYHWVALTSPPRAVPAGETVRCRVTLPPLTAGRYWLEFDCVAQRVAWFAQIGSGAAAIPVEVGR